MSKPQSLTVVKTVPWISTYSLDRNPDFGQAFFKLIAQVIISAFVNVIFNKNGMFCLILKNMGLYNTH